MKEIAEYIKWLYYQILDLLFPQDDYTSLDERRGGMS